MIRGRCWGISSLVGLPLWQKQSQHLAFLTLVKPNLVLQLPRVELDHNVYTTKRTPMGGLSRGEKQYPYFCMQQGPRKDGKGVGGN